MRYPLTVTSLGGRTAVVVGGGIVGERKVNGLLAGEVPVRVVSPSATRQIASWAETGEIQWTRRSYQDGDLEGAVLVFAATNVRSVNHEVAMAAHRKGLLVNVADAPAEGNFHSPAVTRKNDLIISVSTHTAQPGIATAARDRIAAMLEQEK